MVRPFWKDMDLEVAMIFLDQDNKSRIYIPDHPGQQQRPSDK